MLRHRGDGYFLPPACGTFVTLVNLMDDSDPRPQPPEKPLACDCCDGGCDPCVYDVYADELAAYEKELAAWQARHPDA